MVLFVCLYGQVQVKDNNFCKNWWDENVLFISYLDGPDLELLLRQAQVVISRSGYSSLMDYATLGLQQLILVPTPGQTEQEYLARRLQKQGIALASQQMTLDLGQALEAVQAFTGFSPLPTHHMLEKFLSQWLQKIP